MIDLRGVIARLGGTSLTVVRRPPGYWSGGIYMLTDPVSVMVGTCSVQPGVERGVRLPEGVRTEDTITVYSSLELKSADDPEGYMADRLVHRGRTFEVFELRNWTSGGQGLFFKAFCARVREAEADEA